ncbi:MAG: VOC family protein [Chloroflexota bacterium]
MLANERTTGMNIRGINHLAMVTGDLDATVRFYRDVLGLEVVATTGNAPGLYPYRHYFFRLGPGATLAFFEWPDMVEPFHKPAGLPARGRWQFDHLSFDVEDRDAIEALRAHLAANGVDVTHVVDHQFIQSIYFTDPVNGIALEASYWVRDATAASPADQTDRTLFYDPNPVPALREGVDKRA